MEETSSAAALSSAGTTLNDDLKTVIRDIEVLLKTAKASGTELAGNMRTQLETTLLKLQARLIEVEKAAAVRAAAAGRAADAYVHENPWRAIGAAAGVGLVVGLLISRR